MSSPDRQRSILLSPRARQDFIDILRYTGETWGERQLRIYRDKLHDALQLIGRNPSMGRSSAELPETYRLYYVGSHVIIYRHQDMSISVVRILHQRMHPGSHL
jgi:toxin ParE1/3/4